MLCTTSCLILLLAAGSCTPAAPCRLHPELQPYLCTRSHAQQQQQQRQPPHITHILMDRGHPVTLRLSNRTAVRLDTHLSLGEALQHLAAAQQQDVLASGSSSHHSGGEGEAGSGGTNAAAPHVNGNSTVPKPSAAAAAVGQSGVDVQAAACALFGRDLSRCLGIPRTCHRVCAVPDAAGMLAGLSFCLGPAATAGAAAAARAASLSDVLSGMKASLLSHNFDRCVCVSSQRGVGYIGKQNMQEKDRLKAMVTCVCGCVKSEGCQGLCCPHQEHLGRQCAGGHA